MNPLNNHRQSLVLGIILALAVGGRLLGGWQPYLPGLARWLHIVAGVFWIGLLYYFNVVQIPALADAAADKGGPGGAGITKYVAPRALFWFRWGAVATWLTGAWLPRQRSSCTAFTLGCGRDVMADHRHRRLARHHHAAQRVGVIWPNQKKILGIMPATDEEKAAGAQGGAAWPRARTSCSRSRC